ncbi:MAG TPA: ATP-binding protein [Cyanobacteria bacterium UBA8553]|nr:ATP-binding protein [Cyanobacteria bacterium UBA8553]HAJ60142.1 ATP-binding protein [Cyanobacteria bacterium UBA8543]
MTDNIDELPDGGRGLQLMWLLTDELNYIHTCTHQNCLLLVKNYQQKNLAQSQKLNKISNLKPVTDFLSRFNKFNNSQENLQKSRGDLLLKKIDLTVNTDLNALPQVLQWYEQLEQLPIPQKTLDECKLAHVEGFTNAVRHAHKGMPTETPIKLEVIVFNKRLEMKVVDYGQPFDFKAKLREILTSKSTLSRKIS